MSNDFDFWDSVYTASNNVNETTECPEPEGEKQGKEWPKEWRGEAEIQRIEYGIHESMDGTRKPYCEFELQVCPGDEMANFRIWKKFFLDSEGQLGHMRKEIGKLGQTSLPVNPVEAEQMVRELTGARVAVYRKCRLPEYKQPSIYFNRMVATQQSAPVDEIPF